MSESWHDYGFGICTSNLKEEISLPGLMELISQAPELKERVNTFMNNECGGAFKDSYDLFTSYVEQYGMQFVYAADLRKVLTPVMFITGEEDPEEHFGKDTIRLNQDYRDAEVPVTLKIIAGYRHDILHDACAENVYDDIYRFIQAES